MHDKGKVGSQLKPRGRLRADVQRARLEFVLALEDYARGKPAEMPQTEGNAFDFVNAAIREDKRPFRDFRAYATWKRNIGNRGKIRAAKNEWGQFGADIEEIFDKSAYSEGAPCLTDEERHEFIGGVTHAPAEMSDEAKRSEGLRSVEHQVEHEESRAFITRTVRTLEAAIAADKSGRALHAVLIDYAKLLDRDPRPAKDASER